MSDEKKNQETQQNSPPPPVYSTPLYAMPVPVPVPVPAPYPVKDETPPVMQSSTAPVPVLLSPQQYQDQLLAACARGHHDPKTKFGPCGIITSIICFPIGLICLLVDRETRCSRCGVVLP